MKNQQEDYLKFERMLSELSSRFINMPAKRVDAEIVNGLKLIVESLKIDRSSVGQFTADKTKLRISHTYAVPGVPPMQSVTMTEGYPWYTDKVRRGEVVVVSSVDTLPKEACNDRAYLQKQGLKSNVLLPLSVGGDFVGAIGFASFHKEREWPEELIQRLKLVGEIFANTFMRKHKEQELHRAFLEIRELKEHFEAENIYLREEIKVKHSHDEIVGKCYAIKKVLKQIEQVARTESTVLILGETGTGKELVAQEIHRLSHRKDRTMVRVNCAALPGTLVESELFGREKGAYTSASNTQIGRFEIADKSSIFLDEIAELPLEVQAKLLRVLQDGKFERLGSVKTISVNTRIITATNKNLMSFVKNKRFREDLYYRLNVFPIVVPPLRAREGDIPLLVWAFIREFEKIMGKKIETISKKGIQLLESYHWPGNIRELRNVIEHAMILSECGTLKIQLPEFSQALEKPPVELDEMIRKHIMNVLQKTRWRIRGKQGAADILGIKPTTLYSKMKKLGIKRPGNFVDI